MLTEEALKKIPFPRYSIANIGKRTEKAWTKARNHLESEPTGENFESLVNDLYSAFPENTSYAAFHASMLCHAGQRITPAQLKSIAWRLSGNLKRLQQGKVVPPWTHQVAIEWMPVAILRATYAHSPKGKPGAIYEYRVLAGSAAGLQFELFWTWRFIKNLARKLGFRRHKASRFHFTDAMELVRLRLYLLFEPELTRDGQPGAYNFSVPPSFLAYNQDILKRRFRLIPCPLGQSLYETPCRICPAGYGIPVHKPKDTQVMPGGCPAACHPLEYYDKACPRCGRLSVPFDPLSRGTICVNCEHTERRGQCSNTSPI